MSVNNEPQRPQVQSFVTPAASLSSEERSAMALDAVIGTLAAVSIYCGQGGTLPTQTAASASVVQAAQPMHVASTSAQTSQTASTSQSASGALVASAVATSSTPAAPQITEESSFKEVQEAFCLVAKRNILWHSSFTQEVREDVLQNLEPIISKVKESPEMRQALINLMNLLNDRYNSTNIQTEFMNVFSDHRKTFEEFCQESGVFKLEPVAPPLFPIPVVKEESLTTQQKALRKNLERLLAEINEEGSTSESAGILRQTVAHCQLRPFDLTFLQGLAFCFLRTLHSEIAQLNVQQCTLLKAQLRTLLDEGSLERFFTAVIAYNPRESAVEFIPMFSLLTKLDIKFLGSMVHACFDYESVESTRRSKNHRPSTKTTETIAEGVQRNKEFHERKMQLRLCMNTLARAVLDKKIPTSSDEDMLHSCLDIMNSLYHPDSSSFRSEFLADARNIAQILIPSENALPKAKCAQGQSSALRIVRGNHKNRLLAYSFPSCAGGAIIRTLDELRYFLGTKLVTSSAQKLNRPLVAVSPAVTQTLRQTSINPQSTQTSTNASGKPKKRQQFHGET